MIFSGWFFRQIYLRGYCALEYHMGKFPTVQAIDPTRATRKEVQGRGKPWRNVSEGFETAENLDYGGAP
jgi:hypothetical protein